MRKQVIAVVLAAVALFAGAAVAAVVLTGGSDSDGQPAHTMQDGAVMTGEMELP